MLATTIVLGFFALLGIAFIIFSISYFLWEDRLYIRARHVFEVGSDSFHQALHALTGGMIVEGNNIQSLEGGEEFYNQLANSIDTAKSTIHLETYIFQPGKVANMIVEKMMAALGRGVRVRIVLDDLGSLSPLNPLIQMLKEANAKIKYYNPVRWYDFFRLKHRTHRKIIVIDGSVAFTGGAGIADYWIGDNVFQAWRDNYIKVQGPVVHHLQAAFLDHWIHLTGEIPTGPAVFPPIDQKGSMRCQVIKSSPQSGSTTMRLLYSVAVASATKSIDISSAYFIPDRSAIRAFSRAIKRGVRIRVVVPGQINDVPTAGIITRHLMGKLIKKGIEIYQYQPRMLHSKTMVVDKKWSTLGSANFDNRSFALNDEMNLAVFDEDFANLLTDEMEKDIQQSKIITYEKWKNRSWMERRKEYIVNLFRRQY